MSTQRFVFPGFALVRQADTPTHEVEVGKITVGDEVFVVHMIRRAGLPFEASFLVAKIFDSREQKLLWEFPKHSFDGLGLLAQAGDDVVVALVGRGREGKVEEVVPLSSLGSQRPINLLRGIELKRLAAEYLDRDFRLTHSEQKLLEHKREKRRAEEQAEQERQREARKQARIELTQRVMTRGKVEVYAADGKVRYGFPVTEEEWPRLSNGTYVVLVESYDDESGEMGPAIEAFQIVKAKGQNPQKGFAVPVTWDRPAAITRKQQATAAAAPQPVNHIVVELADGAFEVAVYATMDDIRKARAAGLNGGAYVAAEDRVIGDKLSIFSVHAEKIETVGEFEPIS